MKMIGLLLMVAVIVEALVEYGQTIYDMVEEHDYKKALKQGVAIIIALVFAFQLKLTWLTWFITDMFGVAVNPIFDMIVTGIFLSRGANYLSDFIRMVYRIGTAQDGDDDIWSMFDFDEDEEDEEVDDVDEEDDDESAEKGYED